MGVTQIAVLVVVVIVLAVLALWFLRHRHTQYEAILEDLWRRLHAVPPGPAFDPEAEEVTGLPSAARRYLTHAIAAGTPLASSVVLALEGRMGLQPGAEKTRFESRQVLSLPKGMIWQAEVGEGFQAVSGADAYADGVGESRFYLWRAIPVASGAGPDVSRSAAGRVALESVLFLPSALHPGFPHGGPQGGARWEHVDDRTARVRLTVGDHELVPEIQVAPDGHSRSCQSATFSIPAVRLPRSTRASPQSCSDRHGLRLWGMALDPFCAPVANGSWASLTSVRWR
jgi:hypothetical protein